MTNEQISMPIELRPLNIARTVADDPRIVVGRNNVEGYYPNSGRESTSPTRSRSVFYPVTASDSGFVGGGGCVGVGGGIGGGGGLGYPNQAVAWYPRQQVLAPVGYAQTAQTGFRVSGNVSESGTDDGGEDSGKKVKFLCSFGGKIFPRPSDGVLRYVGGQTRIISVRRDVSFQEMMQKMMETYGQPVVVKYQLPEEDLDALVSISCREDLENMMDEYGKMVESDGSAKLRLFLFSAAELDQSGLMQLSDLHDSGQKYVDAVNGVPDVVGGDKLTRRGSAASAASTQNSDSLMSGGDVGDSSGPGHGDGGGLPSPNSLSPKVSQDAGTRVVYVAPNTVMYAETPTGTMGNPTIITSPTAVPESELGRSVAMGHQQQSLGYDLQRPSGMDFPPAASYMHQTYGDPHQEVYNRVDYQQHPSQMGYLNPQAYGYQGPYYRRVDHPQQIPDNAAGYPPHQFIPGVHMSMASATPNVNIRPNGAQQFMHPHQARVNPYPEENSFGARVVQLPGDQIHKAYQPQASPQQAHVQLQGAGYDWRHVPPMEHVVVSDGWSPNQQKPFPDKTLRLDDCYMCQKALPHAHSDTAAHDFGDSPSSNTSDSSLVFHSLRPEDYVKIRPQNRAVVGGAMGEGTIEFQGTRTQPRVAGHIDQDASSPQLGMSAYAESPKAQIEHENILLQRRENPELPRMHPPSGVVLAGDVHSPYGAFLGSTGQAYQEDPMQRPTGQFQYQVKQENNLMNHQVGTDIPPVKVFQTQEPLVHEYSTQPLGRHPGFVPKGPIVGINGRMEAVHLSPSNTSENTEQCKSPANQVRKEEILDMRSQMLGNEMLVMNAFTKADGDYIKPVEKLPSSSPEIVYMHDPQQVESSRVTEAMTSGFAAPFIDLSSVTEHKIPDEMWHCAPPYLGLDSAYANATDRISPVGEWHNEALQLHPRMMSTDAAPSGNSPSALSPSSGTIRDERDPAISNSLFSNQDPWTLRHGTHFPPPRPNKVPTVKETFVTRDERGLNQPAGNLNRDINLEPGRGFKGSSEENIRQELQAVAEGVAASVFQSPVPSDPSVSQMNDQTPEVNQGEVRNDDIDTHNIAEVEDSTKDKTDIGLPLSEGIGRLQIIKNDDLEELRELGSGTFGTVYHGKWRGTDVAIKRINERCFVGKPSEQDRMRNDFWNEAINLADLHHPNVVAFYGVVVDGPGGSVATVTEYMVNGSLRQALQRNDRTLDKRKRLLIAMDVAFGMEYLHGKNIVHFDLKSDNLLVNLRDPHRPICKVGDLGLSKVKCQTLISGGVRGTLPWMAPELLNGSSNLVSEKVDVFSFGIVMWELLTGEEPYADLHYGAIIGGIVSNTLRPQVPESCDPEWSFLMERCWAAEPKERPNFTEVANKLRSMAASLPPKGQAQQQQTPMQQQAPK